MVTSWLHCSYFVAASMRRSMANMMRPATAQRAARIAQLAQSGTFIQSAPGMELRSLPMAEAANPASVVPVGSHPYSPTSR